LDGLGEGMTLLGEAIALRKKLLIRTVEGNNEWEDVGLCGRRARITKFIQN
jgi:hypothetical protein